MYACQVMTLSVMMATTMDTRMQPQDMVSNIPMMFKIGGKLVGGFDTHTAPSSPTAIVYSINSRKPYK